MASIVAPDGVIAPASIPSVPFVHVTSPLGLRPQPSAKKTANAAGERTRSEYPLPVIPSVARDLGGRRDGWSCAPRPPRSLATLGMTRAARSKVSLAVSATSTPPTLARRLGAFDATMLVMGGIIGSGIFINPYVVARQVHSSALILGVWAAGGVIALIGAFVYAELAAL